MPPKAEIIAITKALLALGKSIGEMQQALGDMQLALGVVAEQLKLPADDRMVRHVNDQFVEHITASRDSSADFLKYMHELVALMEKTHE